MKKYVWYVGYGSNLSKQRFLCYIIGGTPKYGKEYDDGCRNTHCPTDDKPIRIPYRLYFALPNGDTETRNWCRGGVAFINPVKEGSEHNWSLCRMWKITCDQYEEVRDKEGRDRWYNHEIYLGEEEGVPVRTITNEDVLSNVLSPSDRYLKTMALGLKETFNLSDKEIAAYLIEKEGIKGKFTETELINIFKQ